MRGTSAGAGAATTTVPAAITAVGTHGEDLYDVVSAGQWAKATTLVDSLNATARMLPAGGPVQAQRDSLTAVIDTLRRAVSGHIRGAALDAANRVTYLAAEMTRPYTPPTPAEVLLLDYYGRELQLGAAHADRGRLQRTSGAIRRTWDALRSQVAARGGAAPASHTDTLVTRIEHATTPAQYGAVAKPFLDEVDELEKVFTKQ